MVGYIEVDDPDNAGVAGREPQTHTCDVMDGEENYAVNNNDATVVVSPSFTPTLSSGAPLSVRAQPNATSPQVKTKVPNNVDSYHLCVTCTDSGEPAASLTECLDLHVEADADPPLDLELSSAAEIAENEPPRDLGTLTVINAATGNCLQAAGAQVSFELSPLMRTE